MKIQYLHASKFGNGVRVAEAFKQHMDTRGVEVDINHIRDVRPGRLPAADLYVFSSPGRMGRPIGGMRRFLKRLRLPAGTRYAVLATELRPQPDPKTGRLPTEAELGACQRVIPLMNEALQSRGLVNIAEDKICVTGIKGPLEDGWQVKVAAFAAHPRPRRRRLTTGRHAPDVEAWISGWIANQQAAVRWFADRVHDADPRISEAIKWRRLTFTVAG